MLGEVDNSLILLFLHTLLVGLVWNFPSRPSVCQWQSLMMLVHCQWLVFGLHTSYLYKLYHLIRQARHAETCSGAGTSHLCLSLNLPATIVASMKGLAAASTFWLRLFYYLSAFEKPRSLTY
jgi:hypothetical protein